MLDTLGGKSNSLNSNRLEPITTAANSEKKVIEGEFSNVWGIVLISTLVLISITSLSDY